MTKVLITGAAGFIGSQLAHKLYNNGEQVTLVDNFSYGKEDNLVFDDYNFNSEIYRKDIRDYKFMDKLFKDNKFDIVYHFAAISPLPDCQDNPSDAVDVNIKGTTILLELSKKYGVKSFIFSSTSAVYENNTDFPSVEENVTKPSLIYPSTKYCAEQICRAFYDAYNIPIVCLRFANVYGPHVDCLRKQPPVMAYIIRELFLNNSPILHSDGKQQRDFVYVDDLLELAILVRKNTAYDVVNVSTEKTISINEITDIIKKYMKKENIKIKYTDAKNYWNKYPELYSDPYPINAKLLEHEVLKYTCLSNKHAKEIYGWVPKVPIESGIKNTVEYTVKLLNEKYFKEHDNG